MKTHKEALAMALEALEDNQHLVADNERHAYVMEYNDLIEKCKEALAQPEHEPVALPLVQFEKVAEGIEIGYDFLGGVDIRLGGEFVYVHINYDYRYTHNSARKALAEQIVGLLTTPPQRTWVGLTDEEIYKAGEGAWYMDELDEIIYAKNIEAKLKEKNA